MIARRHPYYIPVHLVTVWLIREEGEKAAQCRQSQKGYQSVTFPGRQDALAPVIGLFPVRQLCSGFATCRLRVAVVAEPITLDSGYDWHRSCSCQRSSRACLCTSGNATEPLYEGLGDYSRKITTKTRKGAALFRPGPGAASWFQSSREQSAPSRKLRALDPQCAMAHWGAALAAGPHINYPLVPPPMAELAWKELTLAKEHASNGSEVERALIDALGKRYAYPQPEDRAPLDQAYANAMREVWKRFSNDVDVGALFAEAMMDLRPWNQWTVEGQPNPGTEEIIATLDAVLKLNPRHPFANHLYIHAVEASPHPERADAAADRLRKLQPGASP